MKFGLATALALAAIGVSGAGHAATFNFFDLDGAGTGVSVQNQMTVDVTQSGVGIVQFLFKNLGPLASNIEQINFDDAADSLDSFLSLDNSDPKVNFSVNLANLPQGNNVSFNSEFGYQATPPPSGPNGNGISVNEFLGISFNLENSFQSVLDGLTSGDLRIGMHVIALPDGSSDTLISTPSPVPLPAGGLLLAGALGGLAALRRRRKAA